MPRPFLLPPLHVNSLEPTLLRRSQVLQMRRHHSTLSRLKTQLPSSPQVHARIRLVRIEHLGAKDVLEGHAAVVTHVRY